MRLRLFILLSIVSMTLVAQQKKVALLETLNGDKTKNVEAIEMNMVRGELRKAISLQDGFNAFTRTDIDQLMKEHGFQNSGMVADAQRKELGKMSGADYICVSTLTKSNTQFYLEAYLIEVETGEISNPATQYGMLKDGTYTNLFQLCQDLAKELIGDISSRPVSLRLRGILQSGRSSRSDSGGGRSGNSYSSENSNNNSEETVPRGYVDLGLPSGTYWKALNESGFYTYDEAVSRFGSNLPSQSQLQELKDYCTWTRTGNDYKVTGSNGNSIVLPAAGWRDCNGSVYSARGNYWSSTPNGSENAWYLRFNAGGVRLNDGACCYGRSVRLVQNP